MYPRFLPDKPLISGKLGPQVACQPVDDLVAPPLLLLTSKDLPAEPPVDPDVLGRFKEGMSKIRNPQSLHSPKPA